VLNEEEQKKRDDDYLPRWRKEVHDMQLSMSFIHKFERLQKSNFLSDEDKADMIKGRFSMAYLWRKHNVKEIQWVLNELKKKENEGQEGEAAEAEKKKEQRQQ
jgi:hypothetical protein